MIPHSQLLPPELRSKIRKQHICLGGNKKLKIYGLLHCRSGKRMKKENRVFFESEEEALQNNYRPCGHCMRRAYRKWKGLSIGSGTKVVGRKGYFLFILLP
ncbi:Ada metal-binding domain-containing protein [Chryseobacterium pennipullorum]|uniref:Metal-binding protein n=1 Tax=Chryseobacterium pennipullorum TaxID=2258963 RepID=A0A3D9B8X8_9FLAO|nr:Ada metal-binding domain-containing protein [Chryseobacterium pennipullorum]REC50141.1 metal-binding protein [Chryseobacterium pennipullorum]